MRISKMAALGALAVGASVVMAPKADAAFIATIEQAGANVVVTGSGSIDLAGLTVDGPASFTSGIVPSQAVLGIGLPNGDNLDLYTGFSGPTLFGTGGNTVPSTSGSGDKVALENDLVIQENLLAVPEGYVSGAPLSDSSTYDNTTLAALGVTDGTYTWTWGTGPDADSFTINIGETPPTSTPEPASLALLGTGLAALGLNRGRRRKGA